ncbi:MAG: hypothetical protein EOO38_00900 [Cytophagaceae bacterium]|nr:MAG: hypothetical protein EOO38_00900 [Cytophagaceae bacterium]
MMASVSTEIAPMFPADRAATASMSGKRFGELLWSGISVLPGGLWVYGHAVAIAGGYRKGKLPAIAARAGCAGQTLPITAVIRNGGGGMTMLINGALHVGSGMHTVVLSFGSEGDLDVQADGDDALPLTISNHEVPAVIAFLRAEVEKPGRGDG